MVKKMLHIEAFVIFISLLVVYYYYDLNWCIFIIFILAPDLTALGYLINKKAGTIAYNLAHTYSLSLIVMGSGIVGENTMILTVGIIWTAHIAMDRVVGYGLKYATSFKETHLQKV